MPNKSRESHPISLYDENNKVVEWDEAPEELKQAFWISMGIIHLFPKRTRGPDMGHGKCNRRPKKRGGQKSF